MRKAATHKVEWANYGNDRVRFAGEISDCGARWTLGSKIWKYVTCERCLSIWRKKRAEAGMRPVRSREVNQDGQ